MERAIVQDALRTANSFVQARRSPMNCFSGLRN